MSTARNRTRSYHQPGGKYSQVYASAPNSTPSVVTQSSVQQTYQSCDDYTSNLPYPDHTFTLLEYHVKRPVLNSVKAYVPAALPRLVTCTNYRYSGGLPTTFSFPSSNSSYWITKARKIFNPNKPKVSAPLFLWELREFPALLKGLGDVLARRASPSDYAGGYLAWNFGWAPLFADLYSLLTLSESLQARKREILSSGGRPEKLQRRVGSATLYADAMEYTANPVAYPVAAGFFRFAGDRNVWATVRRTINQSQWGSMAELDSVVFRTTLGLNLSAARVWEALPWSWLIDYFINVGDVLESHDGEITFRLQNLNVMIHDRFEGRWEQTKLLKGFSTSHGDCHFDRKLRVLPTTPVSFLSFGPFLTNHQIGILTSLITAKSLKSISL